MRRLIVMGITGFLLAACSVEQSSEPAPTPAPVSSEAASPSSVLLPSPPEPKVQEPCPYLETDFVARANGQRVGEVQTSSEEADPACFFYRADGELQVDVRLYTGDSTTAKALVDEAAPIDTSSPATTPEGWEGGYRSTEDGVVYAVAQGGHAVVVRTNQEQSVKAREIAAEVISNWDEEV